MKPVDSTLNFVLTVILAFTEKEQINSSAPNILSTLSKSQERGTKMPYCSNCGAKLPEDASFCPNCGVPVKQAIKPRFVDANWGERFVAWLIDIIILGMVLTPTKYFIFWAGWPGFTLMPHSLRWVPFVDFGLDNLIYFLYWTVMEGTYGQSLGKMVLKLKVTRVNGERIDMSYAAIESVGKAFLLPIDCIIGWILYSSKNQRLFNYISDTKVVKIRY